MRTWPRHCGLRLIDMTKEGGSAISRCKSALRLRLVSAPKPVLLFLLGAWVVDFFVFVCSESHGSFYILATATLCILGWANHIRLGAIEHLKDFGKWIAGLLFDLLLLILLGVVCTMALLLFFPAYQCYGSRAKVAEALMGVASLKNEITDRAEKAGSLGDAGKSLAVPQSKRIAGGMVSPDGQIFVILEDPPAVFTLVPAMRAGRIEWSCEGYPVKYMPAPCRKSR